MPKIALALLSKIKPSIFKPKILMFLFLLQETCGGRSLWIMKEILSVLILYGYVLKLSLSLP